jgi:hypothetical protein
VVWQKAKLDLLDRDAEAWHCRFDASLPETIGPPCRAGGDDDHHALQGRRRPKRRPRQSPSTLETDLQQLITASRSELAQMWLEHFGQPLPKAISRKLIERILAYNLQVRHLGGLSIKAHRALMAIGSKQTNGTRRPALSLKPGTRLIREWHGKTHMVEVLETGFSWNGTVQRSLSAVASAITGTRWSGRRFFGL